MSPVLPTPRHALLVARIALLRQWRQTRGRSVVQLVALGVVGLFLLVGSAALAFGGYLAGAAVRDGTTTDPVGAGQFVLAGVVVIVAFIVGFRAITESGRVEQPEGMLTTVPHRDLVGGILLAEAAVTALLFGLPALTGTVGFAAGAGSPASAFLVVLAVLAAGAVAVSVGFAAGMAVRNVLARSEVVARHRVALGALVFLVYMGLVVTNRLGAVLTPVVNEFRRTPIVWFADLGLLAVADSASPVRAVLALVGAGVVVAVSVALSVRLAGLLWYADPVEAESRESTSALSAGLTSTRVGRTVSRATGQVVVKCWLRARRAPIQLLFVAYPLFLLVGPVSGAVQTGRVPAVLPATVALYGAWATGAAFTLNPLGDEGAVLPATLTSGVTGRRFVGGQMLAGAVVGAPATALATLATALAGPQDPSAAVGLGLVGGLLAVAATGIAAGIGVAFPRFESVRITRSRRAVVPSLLGFGVYSLLLVVASAPGLVSQVPSVVSLLETATGASAATIGLAGSLLALLVAGAGGAVGARYAAHRFDTYSL